MEKINPINRRIYECRKAAGYTQAEAAKLMGLKRNTYARMERYGNPSPDQLKQLSELFRVSIDKIVYGDFYNVGEAKKRELTPIEEMLMTGMRENNNNNTNTTLWSPNAIEQSYTFELSSTEKNGIRIFRSLPAEKRSEIIELINKHYQEAKNNPPEDN